MADDLDPAVVERAADAIARARGYARGACLDEHYRDARDALTAARAGQPAAPTVSAKQVRDARDAVNAKGRNIGYLPVGVSEAFLVELGIKVTP